MNMKALILLLITVILSGCAFTTERIDLSYSHQPRVIPIVGANDITIALNLYDDRQDKGNKVSSKKNGFGVDTAPILANEDILVTFRRAIETELQARGFKIGSQSPVSVDANLIMFWNDFKLGFFAGDSIAQLNMSIIAKDKNGNVYYSRIITAQDTEANIQLMSGENAKLALDRVLANGMNQLFNDPVFFEKLVQISRQGT